MYRSSKANNEALAELMGKITPISNQLKVLSRDITGSGAHQPGHLSQRALKSAADLDALYAAYLDAVAGESGAEEEPAPQPESSGDEATRAAPPERTNVQPATGGKRRS